MSLGQALISFALLAGLLTLVPGLDTALVLRAALLGGRRHAYRTALGVSVGVLVWGVAAAAGVAALLTVSQIAYDVVRYLGAVYLIVFGVRLLVRAARSKQHASALQLPEWRWQGSFRRGLLTNLLNPKVGIFYLATLPQFLVAGMAPIATGAVLAVVHVLLGAVWFAVLITAASAASRWLRRPVAARVIDGLTGAILVAFGVRTALDDG